MEALSRGANKVISIEKNYEAFKSLQKNTKLIDYDNITLINKDALKFLSFNSDTKFDFVFLDPPFNHDLVSKALKLLSKGKYINSGSKIYIESEYKIIEKEISSIFSKEINIIRQKKSGQVHYCLVKII
jgi:16S rRNA (guanine966-N2)-methyltransferase